MYIVYSVLNFCNIFNKRLFRLQKKCCTLQSPMFGRFFPQDKPENKKQIFNIRVN